jgi:hypothetical protein
VPIVYGQPGPSLAEAADRFGSFVLGGCVTGPAELNWHCHGCGTPFRSPMSTGPALLLARLRGELPTRSN